MISNTNLDKTDVNAGYHLIKSNGNNQYLLCRNIPQMLLIHPVFHYLLQRKDEGIDIQKWIFNLKSGLVELPGELKTNKEELDYYYSFFLFLEENNYFKRTDPFYLSAKKYSGEIIEFLLANTSRLTFEVTDSCNLSCEYCGYGKLYEGFDIRINKFLSINIAEKAIDYFHERRLSRLNNTPLKAFEIAFYGGEPLLNMSFIKEVVAYARKKDWGNSLLQFGMTTNGVLLDKYMDYLAENDFNLLISLDGNKENNSYRVFKNGSSSFEAVFGNSTKLMKKYPEYFKKSVNFISVTHKKNSYEQVISFFEEKFKKKPSLASLSPVGLKQDKIKEFQQLVNKEFFKGQPEKASKKQKEKKSTLNGIKINRFLKENTTYQVNKYSQLTGNEKLKTRRVGTCEPFRNKVFITVNGKILVCEQISHDFYLGMVDEKGVRLNCNEVAEKYNHWYEKMSRQCRNCLKFNYCTQCIFYLKLNSDDPNDYTCPSFENVDAFRKRIGKSLSILEDAPYLYYKK